MASSRKRELHVESSWRMVEGGENDSFDTSILHDDDDLLLSGGSDPSQFTGSQPFSFGGSQPFSIGGSQDETLENFLHKAEQDEQVLLRSPFRPSVPQSVRQSSRDALRYRSPEPEFYMPTVEVDSPRRTGARVSKPAPPELPGLRQRRQTATQSRRGRYRETETSEKAPSFGDRLSQSIPGALFDALAWVFGLVRLAFRYAQKPLAVFLALYLTFGGLIMVQNMAARSISTALSPICRLPGASWLDLPFCSVDVPPGNTRVEFEGLVQVQDRLEQVLEKSVQGASLPAELRRTSLSVRDLRTLLRYSKVARKDELMLELDGLVLALQQAWEKAVKFNSAIPSAIDQIIYTNQWTSRFLDALQEEEENPGLLSQWANWVFSPFQPTAYSELELVNKYIEHTAFVSQMIEKVLAQAETLLSIFTNAEDHLDAIYNIVASSEASLRGQREEILFQLWTMLGGNARKLHNLEQQLSTLRHVNAHRSDVVGYLSELVVELGNINAGLIELREVVSGPELSRGTAEARPLSIHIDIINSGVKRLQGASKRFKEQQEQRVEQAQARENGDGRMIDG